MDTGSKILLWSFIVLMIISISALFYKSFITESYEQTFSDEYVAEEESSEEEVEVAEEEVIE